MNNEQLQNIISDALNDADLSCEEIPAIDLYLDQIVNLISEKNKTGSDRFSDRVLTKTMINNYSKAGLITPVKGKKYTKEQIVQMLFTNSLKNVLSISEIKSAMDLFYSLCNSDKAPTLESYYDKYLDMKKSNRTLCTDMVNSIFSDNSYNTENELDYLLAVLGIISLSDYFKSIARAMLDFAVTENATAVAEKSENEVCDEKEGKEKKKKADKKAAKEALEDSKSDESETDEESGQAKND